MKSPQSLKPPEHDSYQQHRRQLWAQILLPVLLGAAVFVVAPLVVWLTLMGGSGDLSRWSEIATMWLLIPAMIGGLIVLAVLIALSLLTNGIAGWIPRKTYRLQWMAARAAGGSRRAAEIIRRPVLAVKGVGSFIRNRVQRLRERV